ncbi:Uncharacterised protein [Streptococcus pseudoporcinus]|uniref:Phage protein n=1 Tax=Streptococcus pseudoporcinus TaxID=361101 RepID=A0A4V6L061_9STRE|nr:hypothetical protein [Streptococcus pseudoporcinus]VTS14897.1 Uncharacterised protein [Streptococcus pseudoporcinus]
MKYKVIRNFQDLSDSKKHDYKKGDIYPREGFAPSEDFISSLLTGLNSAGSIFITEIIGEETIEAETTENVPEEVLVDKAAESVTNEAAKEETIKAETVDTVAEKTKRRRRTTKTEE